MVSSQDEDQLLGLRASLADVDEPSKVAAMSFHGSSCGGRSGGQGGGGSRGSQSGSGRVGGQQAGGQLVTSQFKAAASLLPRELARFQSGLCVDYFSHGEKAYSCAAPCSWGN